MTEPELQRPMFALAVTLGVQTMTALAQSTLAILAPVIAPELGVGAEQIGNFTGLLYVFAMLSGLLFSTSVDRVGALRMSQWALFCCCGGLIASAAGSLAAMVLAAMLIGAGYGLANPTAASILGRHAPPRRRGLLFSLKQTGVPLGIGCAGIIAPLMLAAFSWRAAVVGSGLICLLCAVAIAPGGSYFNTNGAGSPQDDQQPGGWRRLLAPLRIVLADGALRSLGLASFAFACTQVSFLVFLVSYLTLERGFSLALAASVLSVAQLASICGRPFWGWLGDRTGRADHTLALLGLGMGFAYLALAALAWVDIATVFVLALFCGLTVVAWNGVFFAELVRRCDPTDMARVTGGVQFMTFGGAVTGPVVFSACVALGASYALTFALFAALPFAAGLVMLRVLRTLESTTQSS